ncbi:MAG: TIGR00159 family protein [Deltaproteobacteria bacterium]|nr:TIGR00159 family protein [Deltaproteobacteria bacterium]
MFKLFRWQDYVDFLIVSALVYQLLLLVKGTRSAQMLSGLALVIITFLLSSRFGFYTLHWILSNFVSPLVVIMVILFQDDIRRALTHVGRNPFFTAVPFVEESQVIDELVKGAVTLSQKKIGALIAIEREMGLKNYIEIGTKIDSKVKSELIVSLFLPYSPVHDGAMVLQKGRITAVGCFLPLSLSPIVKKTLGSRHRAAIGLTEETDAVVIVVSEENGQISLAVDGRLKRDIDAPSMRQHLGKLLRVKGE